MPEPILPGLTTVFYCTKPCQPVLMHVDAERVEAGDSNVDPQVKLSVVDQERIRDVSRNNADRSFLDLSVRVRNQPNADAPTASRRLDDIRDLTIILLLLLPFPLLVVLQQLQPLPRQNKSLGQILKTVGAKNSTKFVTDPGKIIFSPQEKSSREVIHLLIFTQFLILSYLQRFAPQDIEIIRTSRQESCPSESITNAIVLPAYCQLVVQRSVLVPAHLSWDLASVSVQAEVYGRTAALLLRIRHALLSA
mmetsp:Transcript_14765/g.33920  ORF Transcript_14765/g.33920 Transcript_14765/m.33920 type:complete len:250 (-) Transcript_14765:491-1240(-)